MAFLIGPAALVDPGVLESLARRIDGHAEELRRRGSRLVAAADRVRWRSPAAATFRADVRGLAGAFHRSAGEVDDAAHALRRHAANVRQAEALIRTAERAAATVGRGAGVAARSVVGTAEHAGAVFGRLLGL